MVRKKLLRFYRNIRITALTTAFCRRERGQVIGPKQSKADENFQPISGTEQVDESRFSFVGNGLLGPETHLLDTFNVREIYDDYTTNERVLVAGDAKKRSQLSDLGNSRGAARCGESRSIAEGLDLSTNLAKTTGKMRQIRQINRKAISEKRCAILREGRIVTRSSRHPSVC